MYTKKTKIKTKTNKKNSNQLFHSLIMIDENKLESVEARANIGSEVYIDCEM